MEIFKKQTNFNFMRWRKHALYISLAINILAILSVAIQGFNFGIDFTGGTLVEVGYPEPVKLEEVRSVLQKGEFSKAQVQYFGTSQDVLIRLAPQQDAEEIQSNISGRILEVLRTHGNPEMRRVEFVGPQVGEELRDDGGLAILFALFGILIYVWLRFEYRFSLGAIVATIHDVLVTVGFFSLTQTEFDLTVLAALLAVLGYSLNDTIVVFDRVRENFRKLRKADTIEVINTSINETLSRTLVTSGTTLLVLIALFFLGGEVIHGFAIAMIIGVIVGTYSTIYVASASLAALKVSKADLMPVQKEGLGADSTP